MILDPQLLAEIFVCIIVELLSIVRDDDPRDSEAANDSFPDEVLDILLYDSGQWFCLDLFGEVVDLYYKELELPYGDGEGPNYIQSPLGERPGGAHQCKFLNRLLYDVAEALALVTRLHVGLGVLLHSGPIVSSSYQLVN